MDNLEIVLNTVTEGFKQINEKMDKQQGVYNAHIITCMGRFGALESEYAASRAAQAQADRTNLWPAVYRGVIAILTVGACTLAYEFIRGR